MFSQDEQYAVNWLLLGCHVVSHKKKDMFRRVQKLILCPLPELVLGRPPVLCWFYLM